MPDKEMQHFIKMAKLLKPQPEILPEIPNIPFWELTDEKPRRNSF